jgi:regulatory protein
VKITALESSKSRKRVNVYIDGILALVVDKKVIVHEGIKSGQEIEEKQIELLRDSDLFDRCFNSALSYLSYRPRTESEVTKRLYKRGYAKDTIVAVIQKLRAQKLISDLSFAEYWRDKRLSVNPKSKIMIKYELQQKGIPKEIAENIIENVDDESSAYKIAIKRFRSINFEDYEEFKNKLFNLLRWRGYSYEVMERTSFRVWQDLYKV